MSKKNEKIENEVDVNTNDTGENAKVDTNTIPKKEEKRVNIIIPKDPLNKDNTFVPVGINGKIYQINRGKEVAVPEEVRNILKNAGYIA